MPCLIGLDLHQCLELHVINPPERRNAMKENDPPALDLFSIESPDGLDLEQMPVGVALGTLSTTSTASTAGCPVSSAGTAATAGCA